MKAIDLTHIITEDMPVYPGTEPPKLTPANSYVCVIAYKAVRDFFSIVKHGVFIADKLHIERYGVGYGVVIFND